MASFPSLPSIHMLPGASCNLDLFSNNGSPDQVCACGLAALIAAQPVLQTGPQPGPCVNFGSSHSRRPIII